MMRPSDPYTDTGPHSSSSDLNEIALGYQTAVAPEYSSRMLFTLQLQRATVTSGLGDHQQGTKKHTIGHFAG